MTDKDVERLALATMAPYIVNREEKVFLMNAETLQAFLKLYKDQDK